jgi:hypothetical protein
VPREGTEPLSLGGRVHWYRVADLGPDGQKRLLGDSRYPDDAWLDIVDRYLNSDPRRVALFEETYNGEGRSARPDLSTCVIGNNGDVYHLLIARAARTAIEAAWEAAHGWGGGERVGLLTSVPEGGDLAPGAEVSASVLEALAQRTEGIGLKAVDDEGVLAWVVACDTERTWSGPY